MEKFRVGQQCYVKDFNNAKIEDLLPIETAVVISRAGDKIKFDIGYEKITLKVHTAEKWEWCANDAIMIRPLR